MQRYQFEKIYSQMEQEFGKLRRGEEEEYTMLFFPMEGNVLKIHRANPKSNSRRLREAIALVLFDVKSRCTGEEYALEEFRDEDNGKLEQALLMAFDPFTNEKLRKKLGKKFQADELHDYYKEPVMCLLRLKESVDTWEKKAGSDGYFDFIEGLIGSQVKGKEMNFAVLR